ncbi:cellulose synthase subunit BcsC-related outer membrane protein [Sphingomonas sp. ZT3P38]|uniref:cellulose biosynthesis protein BcsC n=1 Tax=Parasphingomonas zepuensis TaxID=3096161 RepID=UPI002FC8CBEF
MMRTVTIAAILLSGVAVPALAQAPGVAALLEQGRYWQGRGRADLARQAYRRALALDPANAEARRALSTAAPAPRPAAPKAEAPAPRAAQTTTPASQPAPRAAVAPVDRGGDARAAGFRALDGGDLATAGRNFEAALNRNRNDADAAGGLGIVRLRQSRFGEAVGLFERASVRGNAGKWAEALTSARFFSGLDAARTKLDAGDLSGAQADAEALSRLAVKDRGPALALLADVYERQGRYADAADLARQAGAGGGSEAQLASRVIRNAALQAAAQGNTVEAEQQFQRGLLADQADPWIRLEYARYLIGRGRASDADSLIRSLQTIGTPDGLYAAALLNGQLDRNAAAQQLLDRIPPSRLTPAMQRFAAQLKVDAAVKRAQALAAQGQVASAAAGLRQLAATPGLSAASLASIGGALDDMGDTASAAQIAQQALAAGPSSPDSFEPVIRILARTGQDEAAVTAIERARLAAQGTPDGAVAVARLEGIRAAAQADRLRLAGQYAPAFDLLQQTWAAAPGNGEVLAALARLYQSGNMPSQAAQTYQMVLAGKPRDKGALIGLIGTAGANGDHGLAVATVGRALQYYPGDYEVYLAAGQMEQARGDRRAAIKYLRRAQASYAARNGSAGTLDRTNPFAAGLSDTNPFRRTSAPPAPVIANPFALGGGRIAAEPDPYVAPGTGPVPFRVAPGYGATDGGVAGASIPMPGAAPAYPASYAPAYPAISGTVAADPVMAKLQSDITALSSNTGPRADVTMGYRQRSGETGLSELRELSGTAGASTDLLGGRIGVSATAKVIDAGRPTGSALARFGRNATPEAVGIVAKLPSNLVQADTQHASGVAVAASYESPWILAEVGTTPIGFENTRATFGFTAKPRLSRNASARGWVRREAVTESVVSYAGTRDPVTGGRWGEIMRTGGGLALSWDKGGTGLYGDVSAYRYQGLNVIENRGLQANVGGYMPIVRDSRSVLTGGLNLNWQNFLNNQNYFTYGHGGYFSPQSFLSVGLPIRYSYDSPRIEGRLGVTPGYQSYEQDRAPIYPTDPVAQAALDALKAQNTDVRSYYDSLSQTGFAFSADGSLYYRVSPSTQVGGSFSVNTFGSYDEYRSSIGIRQTLGGER